MPLYTFTVHEATISVYPTDANGDAITDHPLWLGASAEGITLSSRLEEIEDRPSGAAYPEVHHGAESHEITIERIWETNIPVVDQPDNLNVLLAASDIETNPPAQNGLDYRLRPGVTYIVVIKWEDDEKPDHFIYRVYHGVTDTSYELGSEKVVHKWRAQGYVA